MDPAAAVANALPAAPVVIDQLAEDVREEFENFLREYTSDVTDESSQATAPHEYVEQTAQLRDNDKTTLYVDFQHVARTKPTLADHIQLEYYRYEPYLRKAVLNFVKALIPAFVPDDSPGRGDKEFFVAFYNMPEVAKLRELKTARLGQLMSMQGTVTRTSEVRPELVHGTFHCLECRNKAADVPQQFKYTEPMKCSNAACGNRLRWQLDRQASRFVDWQKLRLQESTDEIPAGSMPRSIDVILRHEIVDQAKPGDKVVFTGCLVVVPDVSQLFGALEGVRNSNRGQTGDGVTGMRQLGVRELTYRLAFLACSVQPAHSKFGHVNIREDTDEEVVESFTPEERRQIIQMKDSPRLYVRLARSIAPSVHGHDEIKRGILLMLFGGVHKKTPEGINLRGDINVCIVGDPSTSKSQFLKYVTNFLPRSVYTSGKASSAAGLTASVSKDPETGEFGIEAGALMLADNGICCIDEFDKMDPKDQVAIHEAMEQQTISIAKAGIQATLNARTSILAAANPIGGRYDRSKTLKSNVNITAPIMSRFDLFFVVLDECEQTVDHNIARHIVNMHQGKHTAVEAEFSTESIQRYIKFARRIRPQISEVAAKMLVESYRKLRHNDASSVSRSSYRITVRQLESLVRLSEALARLHCQDVIGPEHVKEATRLLQKSIIHVQTDDIVFDEEEAAAFDGGMDGDGGEGGDGGDDHDNDQGGAASASVTAAATTLASLSSMPAESQGSTPGAPVAAKKLTMTFTEFRKVSAMLVEHLRHIELHAQESPESMETDSSGSLRQQALIDWYIQQRASELQSEEEAVFHARLVRAVIKRLVDKDQVLLAMADPIDPDEGQRFLSLHPNYEMS